MAVSEHEMTALFAVVREEVNGIREAKAAMHAVKIDLTDLKAIISTEVRESAIHAIKTSISGLSVAAKHAIEEQTGAIAVNLRNSAKIVENAASNAHDELRSVGWSLIILAFVFGIAMGAYSVFFMLSKRIDALTENQDAIYQLIKSQQQAPVKPRKRNP
jgi:Zn-dependent membrane protease YugP